jgi:exopolysaccharide production protein ExoZ
LFFIISGFIIATVLPGYIRAKGWKEFFVKRLTRIIPLYWFLSLIAALTIAKYSVSDKAVVLKTIFFFPFFDVKKFYSPIIPFGWSLSYELYFYLLVGLLLFFHVKKMSLISISLLFSLSIIGFLINPSNVFFRFTTSPLLIEFAIGIITALIYKNISNSCTIRKLKVTSLVIAVAGAILMLTTILTGYKDLSEAGTVINSNHSALYRCIVWGIPCGMLVCGLTLAEKTKLFTVPKLLIEIGNASYSAYLIQGLAITYFTIIYKRFVNSYADAFILLCTITCVLVSIPVHIYIERPLIRKTNKLLKGEQNQARL